MFVFILSGYTFWKPSMKPWFGVGYTLLMLQWQLKLY